MILPDVNVLIYAFRPDSPHHLLCHTWLKRVVEADAPFGLSLLACNALVRITSHERLFATPSALKECFGFCDYLMQQPNCRIIEPGDRHWRILRELCLATQTKGPRITDAWFAALAMEHDCEWITLDRDFARFPGLRWSTPTLE